MGDVDRQAHVHEVKAIAEPDEHERDAMVGDQLLEVLAGLLQHQQQHNHLLGPVARLEQVVGLEEALVRLVREVLVHAPGREVPDGRLAHHPQTQRTEHGEVDGRVRLLHEAGLLGPRLDARRHGCRPEHALHDELAGEGEHDGVEGDEGEVGEALAVEHRRVRGRAGLRVREEDELVQLVRRPRVQRVEQQRRHAHDERVQPCVSQRDGLPAAEEPADLAPARVGLGSVGCAALFGGGLSATRAGSQEEQTHLERRRGRRCSVRQRRERSGSGVSSRLPIERVGLWSSSRRCADRMRRSCLLGGPMGCGREVRRRLHVDF